MTFLLVHLLSFGQLCQSGIGGSRSCIPSRRGYKLCGSLKAPRDVLLWEWMLLGKTGINQPLGSFLHFVGMVKCCKTGVPVSHKAQDSSFFVSPLCLSEDICRHREGSWSLGAPDIGCRRICRRHPDRPRWQSVLLLLGPEDSL